MSSPAAAPAPPRLTLVGSDDLRRSLVRDVRARIAAGYYDRDEVRSRLADALLQRIRRP